MKEQKRRPKRRVKVASVRTTAKALSPNENTKRSAEGPAWHIGRFSRNLAEHKKTAAPRVTVKAERKSLKPRANRLNTLLFTPIL